MDAFGVDLGSAPCRCPAVSPHGSHADPWYPDRLGLGS
ncbi:hypothetical protein Lokhon_01919 [Limimaricola hongkongensis DSM 17492]|uniref:Uncharacterized protein n=1 Tax=Limimaricola hongkongensis DSM 17492 TaxID=1122180 RepID=A0A017HCF7_9RHOB|nr:hypothetical protein Lokhon_01919 [Limimaricola hongkongensis DSM 17492]